MDKQEAIGFIQRELQNGRSQEEIVTALSQKLNAPPDVVRKFVTQVAARQTPEPAAQPATPTPAPARPAARLASSANAQVFNCPICTGSLPIPDAPIVICRHCGNSIEVPAELRRQRAPEPAAPQQAAAAQPEKPVIPGAIAPPVVDEELEKFVLGSLSKNRRHSDIVMDICERTGMNWDQAQRLVAQVGAKNRKKLVARQNMLIMPVSFMAVIIGIALLLAGIVDAKSYADYFANPQNYPTGPTGNIDRYTLFGVFTGIALILGGAAGLFRAFQTHME